MADQYKIHKLKNGLRFLHIPKKSNIISLGFIVKVGSRDEDPSLNGISHFLEQEDCNLFCNFEQKRLQHVSFFGIPA